MIFEIEDQHPTKWITDNEAEPPLPGATRVVRSKPPNYPEIVSWHIEINTLEGLLEIAKQKQTNLFINVDWDPPRIIFTQQSEPD
jgi:hypothetical protein